MESTVNPVLVDNRSILSVLVGHDMSGYPCYTEHVRQTRAKRYPNAKDLAERFEISVRQAGRDIEYLQNSLRAPMTYNPKQRGYEYEDEAESMGYYQEIREEDWEGLFKHFQQ